MSGGDSIALKYDPDGNRIYKDSGGTLRKYIVDIVGDLPVILMELNGATVEKAHIYANGQILAQHHGAPAAGNKYFYLHDRLGSVRQIIKYEDSQVKVVDRYTYTPFGETHDPEVQQDATLKNRFMFTGQYYDNEIKQYFLRARQYDSYLSRFTSRDPVFGQFEDPLSLHKYLYCQNEPINRIDPFGLLYIPAGGPDYDWRTTQEIIDKATELVGTHFILGPWRAFGRGGPGGIGEFDYKYTPLTFQLSRHVRTIGSEFSNYLAGYTGYYNYGYVGESGARVMGHYYAQMKYGRWDEPSSRYFISAGILKAMDERFAEGRRPWSAHGTFIGAKFELMRFGYDRILGGEFERGEQIITAELGSHEWWNQVIMLTEFWNAGPSSYYW